jgi:hopanoid biosynthesis associated RND transporter like protein HpnN
MNRSRDDEAPLTSPPNFPASEQGASWFGRLVAACVARAWLVATFGLILGAAAVAYAVTHFAMTTDTDQLLSRSLPYLKRDAAFNRLFRPEGDRLVIVVDGVTPELSEAAAAALAARLAQRPDLFRDVYRPDADPFFQHNGLLYESEADVHASLDRLIKAQPFLGPLAADPSLRGLMNTLSTTLQGVSNGQATLADLDRPISQLADMLDHVRAGEPAYFSWQTLISGKPADHRLLRHIILASPVLDYSKLQPGADPTDSARQAARALGLDAAHGVKVRLTGNAPLNDEEFGSLSQGAGLIAVLALVAIVTMLWMAVRSPRLIAAILVTMLIGLAAASACGLLIFHRFNLISVAFIPLFVGLGIDFGIQFTVRYRSEKSGVAKSTRDALVASGHGMGRSLALAATAIASGFLAFAPTDYVGVSQLGVIAGVGLFIALALNLTVLPAFIALTSPKSEVLPPDRGSLASLDAFMLGHRRLVVGTGVVSAAVSALLLPFLHFDFNPLHLKNQHTESVSTLLDLMRDPDETPYTLEATTPSLSAADSLAARLAHLSTVRETRTLSDFIPGDQAEKLSAISDASTLLDLSLNPIATDPPPSDQEVIAALKQTAADLRGASAATLGATAAPARRLAASLDWLAAEPPAMREKVSQILMPGLGITLDQARNALQASPVTLANLPTALSRDWVAPDGQARVSVIPKGDSNDNGVLTRFIAQVSAVVPEIAGDVVGIREGGRVVEGAFALAGVLSFIAITVLLFAVLRRVRDVAITMAPIVLTGLLTMGTCVVIGQPLNFANIIALPLLFGIGVAFHIYFVMAWRGGGSHLLQSSLTKAVFFSALATATGFGSLWASSHPGTASMGKLLMISLIWTLVSALLFQPALMGPPPRDR